LPSQVAVGLGLYSLALLTCVGNAMVIHAIRTEKSLRKVSNLFIMSLAVADLVVGVFVMPFSAAYVLTDRWYLGDWMCDAWLSIDYTASTASILNLFVLSLDRYWSITSPLKYLRQRTKRRASFMIAAAWLLSLLWILPVTGWDHMVNNGTRQNSPLHTCDTAFAHNVTFKVTAAVANFYVPTISMLYIYGRIFCTIRQRSRNHLGEISSSSRRHRPPLWAHLATSKETTRDSPAATIPSSSAGGDVSSGGRSVRGKQWGDRLRQFVTTRRINNVSKTVTNDEALLCHGNKANVYESLTLLEVKHKPVTACVLAIVGNDTSSGITHCTNVRVQVEYVDEEGDVVDTGYTAADSSQQGVAAKGSKYGGCSDGDGSQLSSDRCGKSNVYSGAVHSPGLISQKELKAARQLGVIMCAFMICWLPYFIVFLVVAVCPKCTGDSLNNVTLWLGYINSTLNPVLYPLCNVKFRRAFAKMMARTCHLPCAQHQTYPLSKSKTSATTQSRF